MIRYTSKGQPYVILPNGRAKFIQKKGYAKLSEYYDKPKIRRGVKMARKRRTYSRGSGMMSPKKMLMGAVAGIVAAKFLGDNDMIRAGAGFVAGGIPGAVAGFVAPKILAGVNSTQEIYY